MAKETKSSLKELVRACLILNYPRTVHRHPLFNEKLRFQKAYVYPVSGGYFWAMHSHCEMLWEAAQAIPPHIEKILKYFQDPMFDPLTREPTAKFSRSKHGLRLSQH